MKSGYFLSVVLLASALFPTACAPVTSVATMAAPTSPTVLASPAPTAKRTSVPLSFTPATYKAEAQGFELDYPSDWTTVPINVIGSRGSSGALYSPGSSAETLAEGGSRVGVTVYLWDPNNDLAAYVQHRKTAWEPGSGGSSIIKESSGNLVDGREYASFVVQAADDRQAFFLFTTLGENYLEISGEGNLALVEEIALTVRPLGFKQ